MVRFCCVVGVGSVKTVAVGTHEQNLDCRRKPFIPPGGMGFILATVFGQQIGTQQLGASGNSPSSAP